MSEMLEDLSDYVVTGGITAAVTKGTLPDMPDVVVAFLTYPGSPSLETFNGVFGSDARLQVQVRGLKEDYLAPSILIKKVQNLLEAEKNFTVNTHFYMGVQNLSEPFPLRKDGNNRYIFACNFRVLKMKEVPV